MSNYEYANATDEQLELWAWEAFQAKQNEAHEERVIASYRARGQANLY
jgi:hypothetical protein